jgi:opacity protein-like surface antigen
MGRLSPLLLAGVVTVATFSAAGAADLLPPAPAIEPPAPIEIGGNWYLRGDVGVAAYHSDKWTQQASTNGSTILSSGFISNSLSDGAYVDVGAGYQFNSWLRADITAEWRSAVSGSGTYQEVTTYNDATGLHRFSGQNNYRDGHLNSYLVMANAYFDLGTWWGLTPFVGGGVGLANLRLSGFTDSGYASVDGALSPVATSLIGSGSKTNFAWALMAGLGYDVSPNLKLELAYRYLNMGDAKVGNVYCGALSGCGVVAQGFRVKQLDAQEVRLGMRWVLGAPVPAPEPMPPLVRKY